MAEYGVAAHWKYKQGLKNKKLGTEDTFAWIRRLLENQQDTESGEFIRSLKVDLFADEVFVFTPQRGGHQPPRRGHPHRLCLRHPLRRGQLHDRGQGQRPHRGL